MEHADPGGRSPMDSLGPLAAGAGAMRTEVALSAYAETGGSAVTGPLNDAVVYALGQIGYGFPTGSRRSSFAQRFGDPTAVDDRAQLLEHLDTHPEDAPALQWTLELDGVPLYILQPDGPFAGDTY